MSRVSSTFLKLKGSIINTAHIRYIETHPNKYIIYMENITNGSQFMGAGSISTNPFKFIVGNKDHPQEYKILSEWIDRLE